jgi:hypothetical protein
MLAKEPAFGTSRAEVVAAPARVCHLLERIGVAYLRSTVRPVVPMWQEGDTLLTVLSRWTNLVETSQDLVEVIGGD